MARRAQSSLAVIFVLVAIVCGRLGVWQLDRLRERRAANATAAHQRSRPAAMPQPGELGDSGWIHRRLVAVGRYDHAHEVILRGQVFAGVPGVHIITPLRIPGDETAILVNRGFVPAPDAATVTDLDSLAEPGVVRVEGIAMAFPEGDGQPITGRGRPTWARLDRRALEDSLSYPIAAFYLRRVGDSADRRFPRALAAPSLDDGPHLSYALQWFGFAAVALVFSVVIFSKARPSAEDARRDTGLTRRDA